MVKISIKKKSLLKVPNYNRKISIQYYLKPIFSKIRLADCLRYLFQQKFNHDQIKI
jgi:hypothetical protein